MPVAPRLTNGPTCFCTTSTDSKLSLPNTGEFQVVYAGKAHPHDHEGKEQIKRIFQARDALKDRVQIVYLANYNWDLGALMTAGVDVWLNTPQPPQEASGTSGMKAALNGVPSLSILDGWWIEGCIEGVTGWAIGDGSSENATSDGAALYDKLSEQVLPLYYGDRSRWIWMMKQAISKIGAYFNTQQMVRRYATEAYFR